MNHHYEGDPRYLLLLPVWIFTGWLAWESWRVWPEVAGFSAVLTFFGLFFTIGMSSDGQVEIDRRGRIMPERDERGRFKR